MRNAVPGGLAIPTRPVRGHGAVNDKSPVADDMTSIAW